MQEDLSHLDVHVSFRPMLTARWQILDIASVARDFHLLVRKPK